MADREARAYSLVDMLALMAARRRGRSQDEAREVATMSRFELLLAAGLFIAISAPTFLQSGSPDPTVVFVASEPSPWGLLAPYQRHFFVVAAAAITLSGLLLEDGRRRDPAGRGSPRSSSRPGRR